MSTTKNKMVRVNELEYEALKDAIVKGDADRERLNLRVMHLEEHYAQCKEINRDQLGRLNGQLLKIAELERRVEQLTAENKQHRAEVERWKPIASTVVQPAFKR